MRNGIVKIVPVLLVLSTIVPALSQPDSENETRKLLVTFSLEEERGQPLDQHVLYFEFEGSDVAIPVVTDRDGLVHQEIDAPVDASTMIVRLDAIDLDESQSTTMQRRRLFWERVKRLSFPELVKTPVQPDQDSVTLILKVPPAIVARGTWQGEVEAIDRGLGAVRLIPNRCSQFSASVDKDGHFAVYGLEKGNESWVFLSFVADDSLGFWWRLSPEQTAQDVDLGEIERPSDEHMGLVSIFVVDDNDLPFEEQASSVVLIPKGAHHFYEFGLDEARNARRTWKGDLEIPIPVGEYFVLPTNVEFDGSMAAFCQLAATEGELPEKMAPPLRVVPARDEPQLFRLDAVRMREAARSLAKELGIE